MAYVKTSITQAASSTDNALVRWNGTSGSDIVDSSITVDDDGQLSNTSQPGFLGNLETGTANVTGNNALFYMGTTNPFTEVIDQNSDFATSGLFTTPVSGLYFFSSQANTSGYTSSHSTNISFFITSNYTYQSSQWAYNGLTAGGLFKLITSFVTNMDAADTAYAVIRVAGGTKVVDMDVDSYFSGWLLG